MLLSVDVDDDATGERGGLGQVQVRLLQLTFFGVVIVFRLGLNWALDYWWAHDGLDPTTRPPLNAIAAWMVGTALAAAAGGIVGKVLGKE